MGHRNNKRVDEKRKLVEDQISSLGYGTTSVYHLEELYGRTLSLSAKIRRLELCREELSNIIQEQEVEMKKMRNKLEKRKYTSKQIMTFIGFTCALFAITALGVIVVNLPSESEQKALATQALSTSLPTTDMAQIVQWCDSNAREGMSIVPVKWVERTPGVRGIFP